MLTIKYQDGSRRIIHPTADFYLPTVLDDKQGVLTAEKKAIELAYALQAKPFHFILQRGKKVLIEKTINENLPHPVQEKAPKWLSNLQRFPLTNEEEKWLRRDLRKKHKREKFNTRVVIG